VGVENEVTNRRVRVGGGTSERDVDGRDRSKAERQTTLSVLISSRDKIKTGKLISLYSQHIDHHSPPVMAFPT
jgi:hypothetical protein